MTPKPVVNAKRHRAVALQLGQAADTCAGRGVRLTELRRQVLSLILEAEGPMTAYRLLDRLRAMRKGAVPPTVYRALDFLLEQRLIHKVERLNAFVPCAEAGQPHPVQFLICGQCGGVTEIEDAAAAAALEDAAERQGFHPRSSIVEVEGTCASCFAAA
jgi:Fur family zinc uptake transcriptional regulator